MNDLRLPLTKKWFDMTKSGEKTEDYREINDYWIKRLLDYKETPKWSVDDLRREFEHHGDQLGFVKDYGKKFSNNIMTLGYPRNSDKSRILKLKHTGIEIREGNTMWGAECGIKYFVIKHGSLTE